jgi:hypothetical protein
MSLKKRNSLTAKIGNVEAGNYFEVEPNGNVILHGEATSWDDLRFPALAQNLTSPAGRIDFNFDDCTVDIQDNAIYPTDEICILAQMSHAKLLGSSIEFHLHWFQNQNQVPNWLVGYRWINIGDTANAAASETLVVLNSSRVIYNAGTIHQLTEGNSITKPTPDTLSSVLQIRLFRDTTNVSTLFAGADPYVGTVQLMEFDIHFRKDGFGSDEEYVK